MWSDTRGRAPSTALNGSTSDTFKVRAFAAASDRIPFCTTTGTRNSVRRKSAQKHRIASDGITSDRIGSDAQSEGEDKVEGSGDSRNRYI